MIMTDRFADHRRTTDLDEICQRGRDGLEAPDGYTLEQWREYLAACERARVEGAIPPPMNVYRADGSLDFTLTYGEYGWEPIYPTHPDGVKERPHATPKTSEVYFIGGESGPIKIGEAMNPASRLRILQCGNPLPLRILATCDGGALLERQYHRRFADARLHGEWFTRTPDLEAEIARLVERSEAA